MPDNENIMFDSPNYAGGSVDVMPDMSISFTPAGESPLSSWIKSSTLYKQAYELFSRDTRYGYSFLVSLEAIPYSRVVNPQTAGGAFIEAFGGNSAYTKQMIEYFNEAMTEIRELVNRYHQLIQSLPVEQSAQLQDAGINAAVTGEGLTPTSPNLESMTTPTESASNFSNSETLINGFNSVLSAFGAIASLGTAGISAASGIVGINLAKQSAYNAQELHDLGLAQAGITTDSPYRVLTPGNTPSIGRVSKTAGNVQEVEGAYSDAEAEALDTEHQVPIGNDPNKVQEYELMSGREVLTHVAGLNFTDMVAQSTIRTVKNVIDASNASLVGALESNYKIAELERGISEQDFTKAYFNARNGAVEGKTETELIEEALNIQRLEAGLKRYENWYAETKKSQLLKWSEDMKANPMRTPYYLAALFGFNMSDTVFHYNGLTMGVHYGMELLGDSVDIIGNVVDMFKNPKDKNPKDKDPKDKNPKDKNPKNRNKDSDPFGFGLSNRQKLRAANAAMRLLFMD